MTMNERIRFTTGSQYGDYSLGEEGVLVGFIRGGDDVPCGVVRKMNRTYVLAPINHIINTEN